MNNKRIYNKIVDVIKDLDSKITEKQIKITINNNQKEYKCISKVTINGDPNVVISSDNFFKKDEAKNHWRLKYIESLYENGIIDYSFNLMI